MEVSKISHEIRRDAWRNILERMLEELPAALEVINKKVEASTGKKLGLQVISIIGNPEDDYRIKVSGMTSSNGYVTEEFQVMWKEDTCPNYFHLFQWNQLPFMGGNDFIFNCLVEPSSQSLAKEVAIFTHHMQIPGVLSRN